MSDSEDDLLENNIILNENTFLRGQNFNKNGKINKISSSTFNNTMLSRNYVPSNGFDRRSVYYRRESSPMSMRSVPDFAPRNFNNSYYNREKSCQRSLVNVRSQSPGSVRSVESSASVSAYIAQAFKSTHFNKYDLRVIKEAYNKYLKNSRRRRIEKRRNLRLFMKHHRRKSGDDSGDQGSDSSISSDDKSDRYSIRKDSMKPNNYTNRTEILNFQASVLGSDMYKDCTENLKQNTLKNIFKSSNTINHTIYEKDTNTAITQKDRFTKGFQLPCQRFNTSSINSISGSNKGLPIKDKSCSLPNARVDCTESENEEIFFEKSICDNSLPRKRSLEGRDFVSSDKKRHKVTDKASSLSCISTSNMELDNDNTFKKPQMPIKKLFKPTPNFLSEKSIMKTSESLTKNIRQDNTMLESANEKDKLKKTHSERQLNGFVNIRNIVYKKSEGSNKNKATINNKDEQLTDDMICKTQTTIPQKESIYKKESKNNNSSNKDISSIKSKVSKTSAHKQPSSVKKRNKKNKLQEPQISPKDNNSEKCSDLASDLNSEKLISKSLQPLVGNVEITSTIRKSTNSQKGQSATEKWNVNTEKDLNDNNSEMPLSNSDISMKPSFIKRKLFTQTLDIVDNKNSSIDSSSTNSPQTRSYNFREKNKVRKLATSQSCLSRDVQGEENILDLIHKIVPADQINMTSLSNKRDLRKSNADEEKENVTATSDCNKGNESDTFTDDEIFKVSMVNIKQPKKQITRTPIKKQNLQCKVIVNNLQIDTNTKNQSAHNVTEPRCATMKTISSCVRSFWDTDFESDVDDIARTPLKPLANKSLDVIKQPDTETLSNEKRISNKPSQKHIGNKTINTSITKNKPKSAQQTTAINCQVSEKTNNKNTKEKQCNMKEQQLQNPKVTTAKKCSKINDDKQDERKSEPKDNKGTQKRSKYQHSKEIKSLLNDTLNSSTSECSILTRSSLRNKSINTSLRKVISRTPEPNNKTIKEQTRKTKTITAKSCEHDKKKTELKIQRKQHQKPKETKSYLNDTLNSSTSDRSILTRSLSSKFKNQIST